MNQRHSPKINQTVQSETGVLLVGAGNPLPEDIVETKALAPTVVAADGGADFCLSAGIEPAFVIGDLDSISPGSRAALPRARLIEYTDQDLTDFEKSLRLIDAPFVIAAGFTAGRMDHTLANFAILARRIGPPTLLVGAEDIAFAAPDTLALDLPPGTPLSLFPLVPTRGTSRGLKWPIEGLTIDPMGRLGTSNQVTGPVALTFDRPGTIVLIPRAHLAAALTAMTG